MTNGEQEVQECDATEDDSRAEAWYIKNKIEGIASA